MVDEYIHEYIFSGSLPENASTYVKRSGDDELYEALQQGKFCYVLNSRQTGKSSLRVRTMSRLSQAGVECASIDLSSVSIQSATQENWYADLIVKLIDSFVLGVDFKDWWEKNQLNSPLMRFSNFLEKHLLMEIPENIVIFIDEIDSVLSLNFPTDDFFAFIRSCYNQRVDNPQYKRLTFCLLGVASPGNLIQDKNRTPFNIGKAISLVGFKLDEVEPLIKGLSDKFSDSQEVMAEILTWTGGQPFLTQKLCQFMVEESEQENPRTVAEVVKSRIIENWESQDEPEHLRTIRSRILRNEEHAGYLLELYQQIWCAEVESNITEEQTQITADNTIEQSELLLSGLVARREGNLRIYNAIYKEVFNLNWVETELNNLRPYSQSFRFWLASGGKDESLLLRGKTLTDAEEWAKDKNLSYQDKQFLAASRERVIQEKIAAEEKEAKLKRERKDKEALEQRNQVLNEANKKAKQQIRNGTVVLVVALLGAVSLGVLAAIEGNKAFEAQKMFETVKKNVDTVQALSKLAGELRNENLTADSDEALRQAGLSFRVKDHNLKQSMLLASISQAYQKLNKPDKAKKKIRESLNYFKNKGNKISSDEGLQIKVLVKGNEGNLLADKYPKQAIKAYQKAYNIIKKYPKETNLFVKDKILTAKDIELVHRGILNLQSSRNQEVWNSLKEHFYAELENFLNKENPNWRAADIKTWQLMLFIANREKEGWLGTPQLEKFSCPDLKRIDKLWVKNSKGHFGFSVQKKIWLKTGNRLAANNSTFNYWDSSYIAANMRFGSAIGWYSIKDDKLHVVPGFLRSISKDPYNPKYMGGLPITEEYIPFGDPTPKLVYFFSRVATCKV